MYRYNQPSFVRHKLPARGAVVRVKHPEHHDVEAVAIILGGPNFLQLKGHSLIRPQGMWLYTCRNVRTGITFVCSSDEIYTAAGHEAEIEKPCPECELEMMFYEGDYICAWCRERLEDLP